MNRRIIFFIGIIGILCLAMAGWAMAEQNNGMKYYVGEVVGLNAVNNSMTITEYNTNSQRKFGLEQIGLPEDIFIGDEVVVIADKENEATEIRLLAENTPITGGSRAPRARGVFSEEKDPFYDISRMQEQMSRMFQNSLQFGNMDQGLLNSNLSFDKDFKLEDAGNEYILKLDMTGMDKDNVKIEIDKNSITLKGQNEMKKQENGRNGSFEYRSFGTFLKTIPLPLDADTRSLSSKLEGDVMVIRLPKKTK